MLYLLLRCARETLVISADEVRTFWEVGEQRWWGKSLPLREIRSVRVEPMGKLWKRTRLLVECENASLEFGTTLSKREQRWVRDCLIATLSRVPRAR